MNARWVILFAAVAQDRSFTRAATRLNLAQPWLSAQIRKLEAELGVALFLREKNRIELTDEGQRLLPAAIQLAEADQRFRQLARDLGTDRASVVHVGSHLPAMGVRPFVALNDTFIARYPAFGFEVKKAATETLIEQVRGGALDLALVLSPFDDEGLEVLTLIEERAYLLAPEIEPWASAKTATAGLMNGQTIAAMPREHHPALYDLIVEPLSAQGARLRAVPEADGRAMVHFVRTEQTPVLMIEVEAEAFDRYENLVGLPLDPPVVVRHCLVRTRNALAGRAADRYWRLAEAQVAERAKR